MTPKQRQTELLQRWWKGARTVDDWKRVSHMCHGAYMVALYSARSTADDWEIACDIAAGRRHLASIEECTSRRLQQ